MLQQEEPGDYVLGTGECHSVQEFLQEAFDYVKLDWNKYVQIDRNYFRPTEVEYLLADSKKANQRFGWNPRVKFKELVKIMVDSDLESIGVKPIGQGKVILASYGLNTIDRCLFNPTGGTER